MKLKQVLCVCVYVYIYVYIPLVVEMRMNGVSIIFSVPSFPANQTPEISLGFGADSLRFHVEINQGLTVLLCVL